MIARLRKQLAESDTASVDTRLILGREDIVEMMRVFMPDTVNPRPGALAPAAGP